MHLFDYVLELADGSQIQVGSSPYTNSPVVMKTDVPQGRLPAFTAANPPKGNQETNTRDNGTNHTLVGSR